MRALYQNTYPNHPESVTKLRRDIVNFALSCGYYQSVVEEITIAVGEASSNIIEHSGSAQEFAVSCQYQSDTLTVSLEDHGRGFRCLEDSLAQTNGQLRGRGMLLMRHLVDRVEYIRKPGNGTIVRLEKHKVRG